MGIKHEQVSLRAEVKLGGKFSPRFIILFHFKELQYILPFILIQTVSNLYDLLFRWSTKTSFWKVDGLFLDTLKACGDQGLSISQKDRRVTYGLIKLVNFITKALKQTTG